MFLAEIVVVDVEEDFIDEKGRLDLEKAGLVAYAHGHYYTLGRNLGGFGFSVNKERLKKKAKSAERKERKGLRHTNRRTSATVFRHQTGGFKSAAKTLQQVESCEKIIKNGSASRRPVSETSALKTLTGTTSKQVRSANSGRHPFRTFLQISEAEKIRPDDSNPFRIEIRPVL